jgi:outer membrane beta-barrel protein
MNRLTTLGSALVFGFTSLFTSSLAHAEESETAEVEPQVLQSLDIVDSKNKQIVKTLQKKNFLKLQRWEFSPHVAFVGNDPFLNRYIIGTGIGYHLTEVFSVEGMFDFSPDLGTADWKPLTTQLVEENNVSPDISKLQAFGSFCFVFSPLYGKTAILNQKIVIFDMYGKFGMGVAQTVDDLSALQKDSTDEAAVSTQVQVHPTANFGAGLRMSFSKNFAARIEGRSMIYIETIEATTLEMKNNFIFQASASFFFPIINK